MADKRDIMIRLLGEETVAKMADRAGDGLDRFGKTLDATENDAKDLDRQIAEVEGSLKTLAVAFARTSDAADRMDLTKAIRRQQAELRKLTKAKDLLPDFTEQGSKSALGFAAGFAKAAPTALRGAMAGGPGAVIGGAVAAFLVPTLSAAVAGAVVGGIGLGGVVGGVALAAKDTRVRAAGKKLGDAVMFDLEDSASRFVKPTIRGIGIIQSAWSDVAGEVDDVFAATSRYVEPLARGVGDFVREIMPGIRKAAEAAGPIIREISEGLPRLGRALGDAFSDFADDADEGASAVRYLFMVVEEGVRFVGGAIHAFAQMYRTVLDVADAAVTVQEALLGWNPLFKGQIQDNRQKVDELKASLVKGGEAGETAGTKIDGGLQKVETSASDAKTQVRSLKEILDDFSGKTIDAEEAQIRLEEAIDNATEAAKRNGAGIDRNKPKQRDNRQALLDIATAAKDAAAKIYAQTGSQEAATVATQRGRTKFLETAAAMKVEKGEAIRLANSLFGIPNVSRSVGVNDKQARAAIARVQAGLGKIHSKNIRIGVYYTTRGDLKLPGGTQLKGLAHGGPVMGPGPKGVDSVPRLLAPGEYVLNARDVDAAGGVAGVERLRAMLRGGGGRAVPAMAGAPAGGGSAGVNLYATFNVNVPATANLAEVGRQNALALDAWARANGIRWRTA